MGRSNANTFTVPILIMYVKTTAQLRTKTSQDQEIPFIQGFLPSIQFKEPKKCKPRPAGKALRAKQFIDLMTRNGWSQADLARHFQVSRAWVSMSIRTGG